MHLEVFQSLSKITYPLINVQEWSLGASLGLAHFISESDTIDESRRLFVYT